MAGLLTDEELLELGARLRENAQYGAFWGDSDTKSLARCVQQAAAWFAEHGFVRLDEKRLANAMRKWAGGTHEPYWHAFAVAVLAELRTTLEPTPESALFDDVRPGDSAWDDAFNAYQENLRLAGLGADYGVFVVTDMGEVVPKQLRFRNFGHYEIFIRDQARRLLAFSRAALPRSEPTPEPALFDEVQPGDVVRRAEHCCDNGYRIDEVTDGVDGRQHLVWCETRYYRDEWNVVRVAP